MTIQSSGGAVSNGEYLAWMAGHTGELYDEMRTAMDFADQRNDVAERLADIKARLQDMPCGEKFEKPEAWVELQAEIRDFLASQAESPEAAALSELLLPIADGMSVEEHSLAGVTWWQAPSQDSVTSWSDRLQARIDRLHKDDQMALINIQDLNSQVQQATQLASSLIAAANQAMSSVLANIKG
jgi:hypothetical protein